MFTNFVLPCAMQLLKCDVREEVVFVVSHFFFWFGWFVEFMGGWLLRNGGRKGLTIFFTPLGLFYSILTMIFFLFSTHVCFL